MDRDRIMISNRGTKLPNKVSESLPSLQSPSSSSSVSNRLTTHTSLDYSQQLSLVEEGKKDLCAGLMISCYKLDI